MNDCECGHAEKKHCKPGTSHVNYKDEMKNAGMHMALRTTNCRKAHCNAPMCCCLEFKKKS
jgi:hypothetical protein